MELFAPSLLADPGLVSWWPHCERHCIGRDSLLTLLRANGVMDARELIPDVRCPVLVVHRVGDPVVPVEPARQTYRRFVEAGVQAELVEVPGQDHFSFAGDPGPICEAIERFTTGRVTSVREHRAPTVAIQVLGGFRVTLDGTEVQEGVWGSRRARTLLKRLVLARGRPVPPEDLVELL